MTKEYFEDKMIEFAGEYAANHPDHALVFFAGLVVAIIEDSIKSKGGDEKQEIRIEGGSRTVTLSACSE